MSHDALYFGCWGGAGHSLFTPDATHATARAVLPSALWSLDSPYPPQCGEQRRGHCRHTGSECQVEGVAALHHVAGWTVLAFWDRSGDHRGGSHSTYLLRGTHAFDAAVTLARAAFPGVWKRHRFDVRPVAPAVAQQARP